jgi:peptidoglycan/LPS O-acetylase OafA/YrhL
VTVLVDIRDHRQVIGRHLPDHSHYRADIDGLRAIAVLAVVAFHAFPTAAPGGFVGVDVFFVISGYLITDILVRKLATGHFSFVEFYAGRARRIFPALSVVLLATALLGWTFFYPFELRALGKHTVAASGFVSNFVLWAESGYFDTAAETKPLLHLWSLGVEEQFYLVWPLFVWWVSRYLDLTRLTIIMVCVASFGLCIYGSFARPSANFFLPFTRMWELAAGGLLACSTSSASVASAGLLSSIPGRFNWWMREMGAALGLVALLVAFAAIDATRRFPGFWALLPTFGTILLIAAGPKTRVTSGLLSFRPMVLVGLISYPLYLWHWPLLTFVRTVSPNPAPAALTAAVILSIFLAALTYLLIERPVRRHRKVELVGSLCCVLLAVGFLGAVEWVRPFGRLATNADAIIAQAVGDWAYPGGGGAPFVTGAVNAPKILFLGDSHMEQYWPRIVNIVQQKRSVSVTFLTFAGCLPLPYLNRLIPGFECPSQYRKAMAMARRDDVRAVVLSAFWEIYFIGEYGTSKGNGPLLYSEEDNTHAPVLLGSEALAKALAGFEADLDNLRSAGKTVYLIQSNATSPTFDPARWLPNRWEAKPQSLPREIERADFDRFIAPVEEAFETEARRAGAILINPLDAMCARTCSGFDMDDVPIYKDSNHLRRTWVRDHATFIDNIFR